MHGCEKNMRILYSKPLILVERLGLIGVTALIGLRPTSLRLHKDRSMLCKRFISFAEGALHLLSDDEPATLYGIVLVAVSRWSCTGLEPAGKLGYNYWENWTYC